jgi:hypothetical protein
MQLHVMVQDNSGMIVARAVATNLLLLLPVLLSQF